MEMKGYQNKAVEELLRRSKEWLQKDGSKMVFKAPTGSGKTVIMAEFLEQLAREEESSPLSFIWAAPRQLHEQSYAKLEQYYEKSRVLECVYFADLADNEISENEILFLNWESIRQENKNTIVRENEKGFYLNRVLENTKVAGRKIVLIVDESHYHATSEISQQLISDIAPNLLIEVSATPVVSKPDDEFSVLLENVKKEGMIKKLVILNDGIKNMLIDAGKVAPAYKEKDDSFILRQAITQRKNLVEAYKEKNIKVNPLLCIQLPDARTQHEKSMKDDIVHMLGKHGITEKNGKLAIWLSEQKINIENISRNDADSEVLIFKQAIALGWDCPRAQILVLFRRWENIVFSVQTLGRIMRMPEPNIGHYDEEILNNGYVYTNLPEVGIHEDVSGGYVHIYTARRIKGYKALKLPSVHRLRQRERTRLSPRFIELFLQETKAYRLADKIDMDSASVSTSYIPDYQAGSVDAIAGQNIRGSIPVNVENAEDLQRMFDYFARSNLSPFYPEERSIGRVKEAIYTFFKQEKKIDYSQKGDKIIKVVLSDKNRGHFINVLNKAKEKYRKEMMKREEPLQKTADWEVPESVTYGSQHTCRKVGKSVMHPFYARNDESIPEKEFIKLLGQSENVKWWYKNGEGESLYFAVPYAENNREHPFYVDFIVHFNDGTIGLYDPKSGITIQTAGNKSDGLQNYIRKQNSNQGEEKLTGGIVTLANRNKYAQGWKVYTDNGDSLNHQDLSNWEALSI